MTPLAYLKWGGLAAALLGYSWLWFHLGGLSSKTALEAQHVVQLQAVVTTMEDNARDADADHAKQQRVIDAYDATKDVPDPASVGTAHRVLLAAAGAAASGSCPVQQTGPVASGSAHPAGGTRETGQAQPGLVTLIEADLDDYIKACGRDDKRLVLTQGLAPK